MQEAVREICFLSVICAAACSIAPEGGVKSVMGVLSSVILMLTILRPLGEIDIKAYGESLAKLHEMEQSLEYEGEDIRKRLNRLVIEEEYCAYIKDKAEENGIRLDELEISMAWSTDGYWMPASLKLGVSEKNIRTEGFASLLEAELGVSINDQVWYIVE